MAQVVRFHETGGPEVLKIEQLDVPPPEKGEVQISVKALGLNRAEPVHHSITWSAQASSEGGIVRPRACERPEITPADAPAERL